MDTGVDYAALGFTVTVDQAAELLKLTRAETLDLIRARDIVTLLPSAPTPTSPAGFLMHWAAVQDLASRRGKKTLTSDEGVRSFVQPLLRRYLEARSPLDDYDEATETGYPLWGRAMGGVRTLNIRVDAVIEFAMAEDPLRSITSSAIEMTLERIGAVRVRGVIPWGKRGGKQRWGTLWRIPQSLLHGEDADALVRDVTSGQREPEEEVRRRPGSAPLVNGQPW